MARIVRGEVWSGSWMRQPSNFTSWNQPGPAGGRSCGTCEEGTILAERRSTLPIWHYMTGSASFASASSG